MSDGTTIIHLIRHGETAWNVGEVFRGRADVPLNERGHEQARAIAKALTHQPLTAVYSSPLQRATTTGKPLADAHSLTVAVDERLTDLDFGAWEGATLEQVRARWPELFSLWEHDPGAVLFPGGESLSVVRERAMRAVQQAVTRHQGQTIAIVSHRVVTKLVLCAALGLDNSHFWQIRQDNGCINRLEHAGNWIVVSVNDLCHLRGVCAEGARDF